jgi:hypothetical protein
LALFDERRAWAHRLSVKPCSFLPVVSISPLRADGIVTLSSVSVIIWLGDRRFEVGVTHRRFPNGGDWAFFAAPCCGRRARKLWLIDETPHCRWCRRKRGYCSRQGYETVAPYERALIQIPRLHAKLAGVARIHPRPGRTLDNRDRLENTLRMHVRTLREHRVKMD